MYSHDTALDVFRQALPVMLVSLVAGLFAGTVLGSGPMRDGIASVNGLLLLLPAFLATRGGVYGSLGSRLSTGIHQGLIEPRFAFDRRLVNAVIASFINGMAISVFISVVTYVVLFALGSQGDLLRLVGILLVAGFLSAIVMIGVLLSVLFVGYRRGLDPDNLIGPVVTTVGDVFGMLFLLVGVVLVELIL